MTRYFVLSVVSAALFYAVYWFFLRCDRWLQISRWYLLTTLLLVLLLPMVRLSVPRQVAPPTYFPVLSGAVRTAGETDMAVVAGPSARTTLWQVRDVWPVAVYVAGLAVMLACLLVRLVRMCGVLRRFTFERREDCLVALPDDDTPPFSFFNYVVIGCRGYSDDEVADILSHERQHVRQHHSCDTLFVLVVRCLLWVNPFVWLYERELRRVHEYLADEGVLRNCDRQRYLRLLYHQSTGVTYSTISNNFNYSIIKQRIQMMTQRKSRYGAAKLLLALPVVALLLFVNCKNSASESAGTKVPDGIYQMAGDILDTYKDGVIVQRLVGGVEVPVESIGPYVFFRSYKAAKAYMNEHKSLTTLMMGLYRLNESCLCGFAIFPSNNPNSWVVRGLDKMVRQAQYPGGEEALNSFLMSQLAKWMSDYGQEVSDTDTTAAGDPRLVVTLVVEKDGSVSQAIVSDDDGQHDLPQLLDGMPRWQPATYAGHPARQHYTWGFSREV